MGKEYFLKNIIYNKFNLYWRFAKVFGILQRIYENDQ